MTTPGILALNLYSKEKKTAKQTKHINSLSALPSQIKKMLLTMVHIGLLLLLVAMESVTIELFVYANRFNYLANINLCDKYLLMLILCQALSGVVIMSSCLLIKVITMLPFPVQILLFHLILSFKVVFRPPVVRR